MYTFSPCLTFNLRKTAKKIYFKYFKENSAGGKLINKKMTQVKTQIFCRRDEVTL